MIRYVEEFIFISGKYANSPLRKKQRETSVTQGKFLLQNREHAFRHHAVARLRHVYQVQVTGLASLPSRHRQFIEMGGQGVLGQVLVGRTG